MGVDGRGQVSEERGDGGVDDGGGAVVGWSWGGGWNGRTFCDGTRKTRWRSLRER